MTEQKQYDLIIIGGGPGGYTSAIKASKRGLKTALIEKNKIGGVCLHKGCIPTKALLQSAKLFSKAKNLDNFGISAKEIKIDLKKVQERKEEIVERLFKGVKSLLEKSGVDVYNGLGKITDKQTVTVLDNNKEVCLLTSKNIIIATGSRPSTLSNIHYDKKLILTSDEILKIDTIPKSIIILGAGAIGVEFASLFNALGSSVTLIETQPKILPYEDCDISKYLKRVMKSKGIKIITSAFLEGVKKGDNFVSVSFKNKDELIEQKADILLTALGRRPNINTEELNKLDIEMDEKFIKTNDYFETSLKGVFAIGDCRGPLLLAHAATSQGYTVIDHITKKEIYKINTSDIPRVTYSFPETASIGQNEKYLRDSGIEIKTSKFPFIANGKALINGEESGFVKIISNKETKKILGIHMIGYGVSELIGATFPMLNMDISDSLASKFIFPHPTLSETIHESLLGLLGESVHV